MMKKLTDPFILHNGVSIPCIGYGTFNTSNEDAAQAVREALAAGYRHIDTAATYGNEVGVGEGIRTGGVPREEIFVTSKVWNTERGYDKTRTAFEKTLQDLGLDYLDLYLIHWPANRKQFGEEARALNAETWRALEDLYREGKVRAIGVSNFWAPHLAELVEDAEIAPMVDQIEVHPGWLLTETIEFCQANNILVEAWSPLGRSSALDNGVLARLAAKYGCSTAQLCIRWVLQHGVLPLPKSVHPDRMRANADVFGFTISPEDMAAIDAIPEMGPRRNPDEIDF